MQIRVYTVCWTLLTGISIWNKARGPWATMLTWVNSYKSLILSTAMATNEKYSSVFRENRCPPSPKSVYGGNFSHEAVTLKIRPRSQKSNKLLILSDLYRLANLVTFHPMVHEITCRQTLFGLILILAVTLKIRSRSPKAIQHFNMSKCYIHANLVKIH